MTIPVSGGPSDAPRFVDLHTHSTASDGAFAPSEVVRRAHIAGITALALTDHDTMGGVEEARAAGDAVGMRIVAGVELSAVEGERETHLLGLHIDSVDRIESRLAAFRATRRTRAEEIVERLNRLDVPVTLAAVLEHAAGGAIGRPHVARALVAGGWVRDQREAFDKYLGAGRPAFVGKHRLTLSDAIGMVHDAGGIAVLAHPGAEGTRARIEALVALGLDGIEVRHPGHSAEDIARLGALAEHFDLVPSGGSDWHGALDGPRVIGSMRVPAEWLQRHDARVERHRAPGAVA